MASGDKVGTILSAIPPGANSATPKIVPGGSTPSESFEIMSFFQGVDEHYDFVCAVDGYDGGGLDLEIPWLAETGVVGNVFWRVGFRRMNATHVLTGSKTYAYKSVASPAGAANALVYAALSFLHTEIDGLVDGERFNLRLQRQGTSGSDTLATQAGALMSGIAIRET